MGCGASKPREEQVVEPTQEASKPPLVQQGWIVDSETPEYCDNAPAGPVQVPQNSLSDAPVYGGPDVPQNTISGGTCPFGRSPNGNGAAEAGQNLDSPDGVWKEEEEEQKVAGPTIAGILPEQPVQLNPPSPQAEEVHDESAMVQGTDGWNMVESMYNENHAAFQADYQQMGSIANLNGHQDPLATLVARQKQMGIEQFEELEVLGQGSYGKAIKARVKMNDEIVVIKQVKVDSMEEKEREEARKEVNVLQMLDHPNVTKYRTSFVQSGCLYIVMEFASKGDLFKVIQDHRDTGKRLPEDQIMSYFVQICLALHHVHQSGILHRDLKTQNIFIGDHDMIKLGDFGVARVMSGDSSMANTLIGTPYGLSPEICEGKAYNQKSDVWSLGCVLYEMATLKHAFDGSSLPAVVMKIVRGSYPPIPEHYSTSLRELVRALLMRNPLDRPTIKQLLTHRFVRPHLEHYCSQVLQKVVANENRYQQSLQDAGIDVSGVSEGDGAAGGTEEGGAGKIAARLHTRRGSGGSSSTEELRTTDFMGIDAATLGRAKAAMSGVEEERMEYIKKAKEEKRQLQEKIAEQKMAILQWEHEEAERKFQERERKREEKLAKQRMEQIRQDELNRKRREERSERARKAQEAKERQEEVKRKRQEDFVRRKAEEEELKRERKLAEKRIIQEHKQRVKGVENSRKASGAMASTSNKALNSSIKSRRVSAGSSSQDEGDAHPKSLGASLERDHQSCVARSPTNQLPSVSGSGSLHTEYLTDEGVGAMSPSAAASPQHNAHSLLTPATSNALTEVSYGVDQEVPLDEMEDDHQEEAEMEESESLGAGGMEDDECKWHESPTLREEMYEVLDQVHNLGKKTRKQSSVGETDHDLQSKSLSRKKTKQRDTLRRLTMSLPTELATAMVNEGWTNQAQLDVAGSSGVKQMLMTQTIPEEEDVEDSDVEDDQEDEDTDAADPSETPDTRFRRLNTEKARLLRDKLVQALGLEKFMEVYKYLQAVQESEDDSTIQSHLERLLAPDKIGFAAQINNLIAMEVADENK